MQTVTSAELAAQIQNAGDIVSLTDSRDGQIYPVSKVSSYYIMARNLAIGCNGSGANYGSNISSKTLSYTDTHISSPHYSTYTTPTRDLTSGTGTYYVDDEETQLMYYAAMHCDSTYGAWYNYCAVSAGYSCDSTTTQSTPIDICPSGWSLMNETSMNELWGMRNIANFSNYGLTVGGFYNYSGTLTSTSVGMYWGDSNGLAGNSFSGMDYLQFSPPNNIDLSYIGAKNGLYARCIKSIYY